MISMMRVYGLFAGAVPGEDQKKGIKFTKVTIIFEGGKKHNFKVVGRMTGMEPVVFGDKITVDIDSPQLTNFGEMASYGDCSWLCSEMKLLSDKAAASQQQKPA